MQRFEGKTAVVTGAASGIGRALAERFAAAGMNVVLADVEEEPLARAAAEIGTGTGRVIGVPVDTRDRESVRALAARVAGELGPVHVLCNNAGVSARNDAARPVWELPNADWDWVMGVNFWGVLHGLQVFVPDMLAHGEEGHVVNTASIAGWMPGNGIYAVSKHAVVALTETLYHDLKRCGARVGASVLCPGLVNTRIFDSERNRPSGLGAPAEADPQKSAMAQAAFASSMPPSEVAEQAFDAIREARFYVLTHPAWGDSVRARVEAALTGTQPPALDVAEMLRRKEAGERF